MFNVDEIENRCKFHQHFYVQIFRTNVILAAFSSYFLALAKNSNEKRMRKMLMKLTAGKTHILISVFSIIYYGIWPAESRTIIDNFASNIGATPWWAINNQVSISSTFYSHTFCTKVFCAAFL
jgi:hypothetical protein